MELNLPGQFFSTIGSACIDSFKQRVHSHIAIIVLCKCNNIFIQFFIIMCRCASTGNMDICYFDCFEVGDNKKTGAITTPALL